MTRMFTIAFSIWALIGLVAYRPHLLMGLQKMNLFSSNSNSVQKPKLRKLAKSYKIKNKHSHLMAKLNRTKKVKQAKSKGSLENAFKSLTIAVNETKPNAAINTNETRPTAQEPSLPFKDDAFSSPPQLAAQPIEPAAQPIGMTTSLDTIDNEFSDNSSESLASIPPPEPNESVWSQDDLITAFDQININVLQYGADYKSAFQQLSDDVLASATNENLKGQMLDQIQKEFDAYIAYFDGSQISSL